MDLATEAQKLVWGGAIPLRIHLHEAEITTLSPPPPLMVLGPRLGYLPLLAPLIKSHFETSMLPVTESMWLDYKGLPLKWYIPTGVLFDLLCAECERPWNLTVHYREYPSELLSPSDDEECVKWSFMNSLKEAAYIINGNCKSVMNLSQSDQTELWKSVENGNLEGYLRVAFKLKLGALSEDPKSKASNLLSKSETDHKGYGRTGRVPVRLYLRNVDDYLEEFEDADPVNSWDDTSYINRPIETRNKEGVCCTLHDALKSLLPELFADEPSVDETAKPDLFADEPSVDETEKPVVVDVPQSTDLDSKTVNLSNVDSTVDEANEVSPDSEDVLKKVKNPKIKRICIQGIEPRLELPLSWIVSNLMNPDFYLHICLYVAVPTDKNTLNVE